MRGAANSLYSVLNALMQIGDDLQRSVPLKQAKDTLRIFRSLNAELREKEAETITTELREVYFRNPEGMKALDLLHWLGLRVCMCLDFAVIFSESDGEVPHAKERSPNLMVRSHIKLLENGLFWTCAASRDTTPEDYSTRFQSMQNRLMQNGADSCSKLDLTGLIKSFLFESFPQISNDTILEIISTFLEVSGTGLKNFYTWEEVASFKTNLYPILLWVSVSKVKEYLKQVYKATCYTVDSNLNTEGVLDTSTRPAQDKQYLSRAIEKVVDASAQTKPDVDGKSSYLLSLFNTFKKFKVKSLVSYFK